MIYPETLAGGGNGGFCRSEWVTARPAELKLMRNQKQKKAAQLKINWIDEDPAFEVKLQPAAAPSAPVASQDYPARPLPEPEMISPQP